MVDFLSKLCWKFSIRTARSRGIGKKKYFPNLIFVSDNKMAKWKNRTGSFDFIQTKVFNYISSEERTSLPYKYFKIEKKFQSVGETNYPMSFIIN